MNLKKNILALAFVLPVAAQVPQAGRPEGPKPTAPRPKYDLAREQRLEGAVVGMALKPMGPGKALFLTVQAGDKAVEVMIAPEFALKKKQISYALGDQVKLLYAPAGGALKARWIERGGVTLTLLDAQGEPVDRPKPYDLAHERSLRGQVTAVQVQAAGPGKVVTLSVEAEGQTVTLFLAPESVLAEHHISFKVGDRVAATCAPVEPGRFRVREIACGERTLTLLDKEGRHLGNGKPSEGGPAHS
nr:hypothetical protein [uncultured Holophaga sp.]